MNQSLKTAFTTNVYEGVSIVNAFYNNLVPAIFLYHVYHVIDVVHAMEGPLYCW